MERRLILKGGGGLCAVALLAPFAGRAAAPLTVAAALNKAGRRRMLAQRAAKARLMLGLGTLPSQGRALLDDSMARFDAQLAELRTFTPNAAVGPALARLDRGWGSIAPCWRGPRRARWRSTSTLPASSSRTPPTSSPSPRRSRRARPVSGRVNLAGRQRMLSQRMAKFYLFHAWDINARAVGMELNWARAEFSSGMHQLYQATHDLPAIRAPLVDLDRQWVGYRDALAPDRTGPQSARLAAVAEYSEQILTTAEQLVALFEQHATPG